MKTMICEMCGCRDVVKRDGLYVCSECGTKYSPADARKLIWILDGEEGNELSHDKRNDASNTPPTYEEWFAASHSVNAGAGERVNDDQNGCVLFTGLFVELLSNAILAIVVLSQAPQKLPLILHGNVADLIFVLAGIAAASTLALSVGVLVGRCAERSVSMSAATCSALCCALSLMNMGDGPLLPIIYLLFALIDAITALVLRKA